MSKNIVALTACPTGVAHTFMAAEALEEEAKKRGYVIQVETRGSVGAKNTLSADAIAKADVVIRITSYNVCYTKLLRREKVFLSDLNRSLKRHHHPARSYCSLT